MPDLIVRLPGGTYDVFALIQDGTEFCASCNSLKGAQQAWVKAQKILNNAKRKPTEVMVLNYDEVEHVFPYGVPNSEHYKEWAKAAKLYEANNKYEKFVKNKKYEALIKKNNIPWVTDKTSDIMDDKWAPENDLDQYDYSWDLPKPKKPTKKKKKKAVKKPLKKPQKLPEVIPQKKKIELDLD